MVKSSLLAYKERFVEKMDDDFNTADAISVIFELIRDVNIKINENSSKALITFAMELIRDLGSPLGILQNSVGGTLEEEIEALIEKRNEARKNRDFATADKIRNDLAAEGIILEDTSLGVRWSRKS